MVPETNLIGIIASFLAVIVPVGLGIFSIFFKPKWMKDKSLAPSWTKINVAAITVGLLSGCFGWFMYKEFGTYISGIAFLNSSLLGFSVFQTFFTDFWYRLADRRILNISTLISLLFGIYMTWDIFGKEMLMIYGILFFLATIVLFIPSIGSSDGRALQLVVSATVPLVGLMGFQWGIVMFLILICAFGIGNAIYKKDLKSLVKKVSMPLVPIILLAFLIVILFYNLFF